MATTTMKKSRQRDAILANLKNRCDHPTADMIYLDLRKDIPNISLGTVYRNLSLLADHGMIQRLSVDGKAEHFDACTKNHYHFICQECGEIYDLALEEMTLNDTAQKVCSGRILRHTTNFFGVCEHCVAKEEHGVQ